MKKSLYEWCIETPNKYKDSIVKAWTGIQVDNKQNKNIIKRNIDIHDVSFGSPKYFIFECDKGHKFITQPNKITSCNTWCSYCHRKILNEASNKPKTYEDSFAYFCRHSGEWGEKQFKEWTGTEVKRSKTGEFIEIKHNIGMDSIKIHSGRTFKFKCTKCNRYYYQQIKHKTERLQNCSLCSKDLHTSFSEQFIFNKLKDKYSDTINRKIFLKDKYVHGLEIDIYIPSKKIAIEYSPTYWHCDLSRGIIKQAEMHRLGIDFIEIIDNSFDEEIEPVYNRWVYKVENSGNKIGVLNTICEDIINYIGE